MGRISHRMNNYFIIIKQCSYPQLIQDTLFDGISRHYNIYGNITLSGREPNCDSTHSYRLYSVAPLEYQANVP